MEREVHQPTSTLDAVRDPRPSGQLEVIGKLDALAKSLRSSEAWEMLSGRLSVSGSHKRVGLVAYNIYNPPEGNIYI